MALKASAWRKYQNQKASVSAALLSEKRNGSVSWRGGIDGALMAKISKMAIIGGGGSMAAA